MSEPGEYVLQSEREELERLAHQSRAIEPLTRLHLGLSGISPGMRVLDLGTGIGDVAFLIAEQVGSEGQVVGIDQAPQALAYADQRREERGLGNVRFVEGDVRTWRDPDPFDAVVGRLILFHVAADAPVIVRHHAAGLRDGGIVLMMDFDVGAARGQPAVPFMRELLSLMIAAFRSAGADPMIGTRLQAILREAGLREVRSFGAQAYLEPDDPAGPRMIAGVVRSLLPAIERTGLATADDVDIETLEARIAEATRAAGTRLLPPTLVGAIGRVG